MRRILPLLGVALFCSQVMADELDLGLNSDAVYVQYVHHYRESSLRLDGGWLHHTDNGDVAHVGLLLADLASSGPSKVEAGLGGRLVYTDGDRSKQDGLGLPLGGFIRFTPQQFNRVSLGASLYLAPDVLTVGDLDKYQEYAVRASYNLLREADIYIGARYVKGEYNKAPDVRFDTGMHIGITLRF
ncbi:MAG: hypothetical protein E2O52_01965 [Gammaproteobacteria bacterium]|nr:MAG: hypothetical protein E2O52_01965 [Gammaproteobacteria bacterium]